MNIGALMQLGTLWERFSKNHPKVPEFADNVKKKGFCAGQEIAVAVRYPDGTEYKTGIRLKSEDLELLRKLSELA